MHEEGTEEEMFDILSWYLFPPLDGAENPKIYSTAFCVGEV